jgi:hypothetical protein
MTIQSTVTPHKFASTCSVACTVKHRGSLLPPPETPYSFQQERHFDAAMGLTQELMAFRPMGTALNAGTARQADEGVVSIRRTGARNAA